MKIDLWFDFVCPYCYGGKKIFEEALKEFNNKEEIIVNYRSLQLNPDIAIEGNDSVTRQLAKSYKVSESEAFKMMGHSIQFVEEQGLIYNYKDIVVTNTMNAHRLVFYAKEYGKADVMVNRIFKAHFVDGINIGNINALGSIGEEIGLDKRPIIDMLKSDAYLDETKKDNEDAIKLNIEVVPTFLFEDGARVAGVLDNKSFHNVM